MPPPSDKKPAAAAHTEPIVTPPPAAKREPFEAIAARRKTELWVWKAMAAYARWAQGREVTEAEFIEVEKKVLGVELLPTPPAAK